MLPPPPPEPVFAFSPPSVEQEFNAQAVEYPVPPNSQEPQGLHTFPTVQEIHDFLLYDPPVVSPIPGTSSVYFPEHVSQTARIIDSAISRPNSNTLSSYLIPPYEEFEDLQHIPLPLPFSTPGPIHSALDPKSTAPSLQNTEDVPIVGWPDLFSLPDSLIYPASSSPDPLAPPSHISLAPSFSLNSQEVSASDDLRFQYSADTTDDYDSFADPDVLTFPNPNRSNPNSKSDPFSTPGPPYRPVYFSSPTSDPSSDAVEPDPRYEMEIDYETLNFKFKPFIRTGADSGLGSWMRQTHAQTEIDNEWNDKENEDIEYDEVVSQFFEDKGHDENQDKPLTPPLTIQNKANSHPPNSYDDEPLCTPKTPAQDQVATLSPQLNPGPVFAPAPGIFISPLRNGPDSPIAKQDLKVTVRLSHLITLE
jgi:hypothetical protein